MKLKLYKPFEHWQEHGPIWILSDPHFEDEDCYSIDCNWPTPEEHVELINSKVGKKDTLIILGDIGNVEWVKKLKGYKVLVMGNHDKGASNYKKHYTIIDVRTNEKLAQASNFEEIKEDSLTLKAYQPSVFPFTKIVNDNLFDEIYEGPVMINEKILLSHEPIKLPFGINIHGHDHAGIPRTEWANENVMFNVASNVIGYTPMRLDKLINGIETKSVHRVAINKAISRKENKEINAIKEN